MHAKEVTDLITRLDMQTWPRAAIYTNYLDVEFPYINIGSRVDVSGLLEFSRREGLSFYFALIFEALKTADSIENFRYRFDAEGPFVVDKNVPILTHLRHGEDRFVMIQGPDSEDVRDFCRKLRLIADNPNANCELTLEHRKDIINFSCLPWLDYTHFVRTIRKVGRDTNPKFSWGRYTTENGKTTLNLSIQVHHGLMDGYHAGQFYLRLQERLDSYK